MCRRGVLDDVGDDPHARLGRIDVGVADHELLEDVVLDRPLELLLRDALLLGGDDVAREHGEHRAVHGHRDGHLVERDPVEQDLHVLDGVDRDAGLADVADDARVVAVVAPVGREVEGDRQALLARRPGWPGRRRSTPRRWRSPRTGGSSTGGWRTSSPAHPGRTGRNRAGCPRASRPSRSSAVNSGSTGMPSGVSQVSESASFPPSSLAASSRQSRAPIPAAPCLRGYLRRRFGPQSWGARCRCGHRCLGDRPARGCPRAEPANRTRPPRRGTC